MSKQTIPGIERRRLYLVGGLCALGAGLGAARYVVTRPQPPAGHPLLDPALLALPNFLLTPHVAWSSRPAMQTLADQLIANIEAFAAGTPQNRVA